MPPCTRLALLYAALPKGHAVLDAACQSEPDLWGLRYLDLQIVLPADDSEPVLRLLGETYPLPVKLARRLPQRRGR
jgi:hypothetical protein